MPKRGLKMPIGPSGFLSRRSLFDWLIAGALLVSTFWIFWLSPVRQVTDSNYSLLLSDSLLRYHTFTLDQYEIPHNPPFPQDYALKNGDIYQLEWVRGRLFYFFPPGSSVLSVPFVALMNTFGVSPVNPDGSYNLEAEIRLEALFASLLMAISAAVFYLTGRLLLSQTLSLLLAIGGALGTQVWSTASRGLWSDTWGILLLAVVAFLLVRSEVRNGPIQPELMATLLSWSYFVRPTANIPILIITIYIALYYRHILFRFLLTGMLWLIVFVVYSWHYFGKLLPSYYLARRLSFTVFFQAMAGHLISPSRGLFIYIPALAFVVWLLVRYRAQTKHGRLLWLSVAIVVVHFLITCGFDHWWGGFCYGPRLMASLVPWFVLLAGIALSSAKLSLVEAVAGLLLLAASVFANARGAVSIDTWIWNTVPVNVDVMPERLWNWKQPQMLAGLISPPKPNRAQVLSGRLSLISPEAQSYLWYGWSAPEVESRWTDGHEAAFLFRVADSGEQKLSFRLAPFLAPGKLNQQRLVVKLNGHELGQLVLNRSEPTTHTFLLRPEMLADENVLTFGLPDATVPSTVESNLDARQLGVAVLWIELEKHS